MTIKYTAVSISVIAVTAKAILCDFGYGQQFWVPKSCFEDEDQADDLQINENTDVEIATWFLDKNEIDY
jgi:hypothetical protein